MLPRPDRQNSVSIHLEYTPPVQGQLESWRWLWRRLFWAMAAPTTTTPPADDARADAPRLAVWLSHLVGVLWPGFRSC
jgi:hypothetical protein